MPADCDHEQADLRALQNTAGDLTRLQEMIVSEDRIRVAQLRRTVAELNELGAMLKAIGPAAPLNAFQEFIATDPALAKLENLAAQQRQEINFFEVLGVHDSEIHHSNFLRWLLDPQANHSTGSHFLEKFLHRTVKAAHDQGIPTADPESIRTIDWSETEVCREWQYIDILVVNRKAGFVCAIENKIWSDEGFGDDGVSQLTSYRRTLEREFPRFDQHRVLLSPAGAPSRSKEEKKHWVPESYAAVHELLVATIEDCGHATSREGRTFLSQYEAVLRRKIVPEKNEITRIAREIYLEHRDAIELIYQNRPNYRAGIKQALKEAIADQKGWCLEREDADYLRFRISDWEQFEAQRTGTAFEAEPKALLVFAFYCPAEPTNTGGPALGLGPGTDKAVREKLFECAQQNPKVFQPRETSLQEGWTHLHDYRWNLLDNSDLGSKWADGSARAKLTEWVKDFANDQLPSLNELIIQCLDEFGRQSA